MNIINEQFTNIEQRLGELHLQALREGNIEPDKTPLIARYILDHIPDVKTHQDLVLFLQELVSFWPFFSPVLMEIRRNGRLLEDRELADRMGELVRGGNIDDALRLVKEGGI